MFSSVRARYQSILEELLENNSIGDAVSGDFTARHSSGSYFCRYRSCPRAVQGFSSSHLRHEHENSHTSYVRCTDSRCGLFGRALKNRAALNRHIQKYHDGDGLAAIPTCLRRTSALLQQDRPRFLLQEPSAAGRKRDDDVMGDGDMAIDPVPDIQPPGLSIGEDQEQYNIRCICGYDTDDGNTVCCYTCNTWQHTECYYNDKGGNVPTKEQLEVINHFCADCQPRLLNAKGAAERQRIRRHELDDRKVKKATAKGQEKEDPRVGVH